MSMITLRMQTVLHPISQFCRSQSFPKPTFVIGRRAYAEHCQLHHVQAASTSYQISTLSSSLHITQVCNPLPPISTLTMLQAGLLVCVAAALVRSPMLMLRRNSTGRENSAVTMRTELIVSRIQVGLLSFEFRYSDRSWHHIKL